MIADWIDEELRNWAKWLWSGPWPHPLPPDHCASIEHRYVGPHLEGAEVEQAEQARRIRPHVESALKVERAFRERLSGREQSVLAAEYPRRHDSGRHDFGKVGAARRLRISLAMYDAALLNAARLVGEAFQERDIAVCR